jgi:PAS domain S-box-containing protein
VCPGSKDAGGTGIKHDGVAPRGRPDHHEPLNYALKAAALAAVYVAAAKLGIELSVARGVVTPVWAPTGIAIAALFLFGRNLWPAVALGALVANATSDASLGVSAAIAGGNTLEALVGSELLRRADVRPALDRVRDVIALILLAAVAAPVIAATNGVTALWIAGDVGSSSYGSEWLLWWVGDAMGALVVAPLALVWSTNPLRRIHGWRRVEAVVLVTVLVAISVFVFLAGSWRYPHLIFPILIWATLRFRQPGAVTGSFLVTAIAIAGAVDGSIPLADRSDTEIVQILEGLLGGVAVSLLILGAVLEERVRAVEQVAEAVAGFNEAQQVARVGNWDWNIAEDTVKWSDELFRLSGLEPQSREVTYESYLETVHPDDRDFVRETVARAYAEGEPFVFDQRIVLPDGTVRWTQSRGRVVTDDTGTPVRMVGTAQDVTERKRLDALRDTILASVSHELRTPLTSILGFSLTLDERGAELDPERRREIVRHLAEQARRLSRLLSDLLDLDRLRLDALTPTFTETDVAELVARVTSAHGIAVQAEPVVAEVDPAKVERIVENLLVNARKHTPGGTDVHVSVESQNGGVLIAVDDRGPGVAEEERQAIFEMFNRGGALSADVPGAGVGLALVAQFAALHGGRAWVEENPGGGASFRVFLPSRNG